MSSPAKIRKDAEASFDAGLYCAESVLLAIARAEGIESELVPKIATGFCSGMARTCGPCGALTGGIMAIGLVLGRSDPSQSRRCYLPIQQLVRRFEREFGARDCDELLGGLDLGLPQGQLMYRVNGLRERCVRYTGRAAEMAAKLIAEARKSGPKD